MQREQAKKTLTNDFKMDAPPMTVQHCTNDQPPTMTMSNAALQCSAMRIRTN